MTYISRLPENPNVWIIIIGIVLIIFGISNYDSGGKAILYISLAYATMGMCAIAFGLIGLERSLIIKENLLLSQQRKIEAEIFHMQVRK